MEDLSTRLSTLLRTRFPQYPTLTVITVFDPCTFRPWKAAVFEGKQIGTVDVEALQDLAVQQQDSHTLEERLFTLFEQQIQGQA